MNKKSVICFAMICFGLSSCDKNNSTNNPVDNTKQILKDSSIQGKTFNSECEIKPLNEILTGFFTLGEASIKSQKVQYRFSGANVFRTTRLYGTKDCSEAEYFVFLESGELKIQSESKTADGATFIDFDYKKVNLSVPSQEGLVIANTIGVCGAKNWALNSDREVTVTAEDVTCYNMKMPRKEFNVYRIDNEKILFFGAHITSNTPETRPTSINADIKYITE